MDLDERLQVADQLEIGAVRGQDVVLREEDVCDLRAGVGRPFGTGRLRRRGPCG